MWRERRESGRAVRAKLRAGVVGALTWEKAEEERMISCKGGNMVEWHFDDNARGDA
jgi:hypothetical protein